MDYILHLSIFILIYTILALSLNLVIGYTGLVSIAQAAFYGIGAYATAILTTQYHFTFLPSLMIGILAALIISFVIGLVLSKFKGDFYMLTTLGFNIIMVGVFRNWHSLTNGPLGITGIPKPDIFGWKLIDTGQFFVLALMCCLLVFLFCRLLVNTSFGRVLKAIREDEAAVQVFGYKTSHYKLAIFVMAAGLAAIAGSLFASYVTFIDPMSFNILESVLVLSIIILGGLANLKGSVLGAVILTILPELLRFVGLPESISAQMRQLIYGLLLIVLMLYRPQGLMGEYKL